MQDRATVAAQQVRWIRCLCRTHVGVFALIALSLGSMLCAGCDQQAGIEGCPDTVELGELVVLRTAAGLRSEKPNAKVVWMAADDGRFEDSNSICRLSATSVSDLPATFPARFRPTVVGTVAVFYETDDEVNGAIVKGSCTFGVTARTDSDGDGIPDVDDNCPDTPNTSQCDDDEDGVCDELDVCEGSDDNDDSDGDGIPDDCDEPSFGGSGGSDFDTDADGLLDSADNCRMVSNADQADMDDDDVGDVCDNCIDVFNPTQENEDDDLFGDACPPRANEPATCEQIPGDLGGDDGVFTDRDSTQLNSGATLDDTDCGQNDTIDRWYCWTAQSTGTATATTCSDMTVLDAVLAVFNADETVELACNDDDMTCAMLPRATENSLVTWDVVAGESYLIRMSGHDGERGVYELTLRVD